MYTQHVNDRKTNDNEGKFLAQRSWSYGQPGPPSTPTKSADGNYRRVIGSTLPKYTQREQGVHGLHAQLPNNSRTYSIKQSRRVWNSKVKGADLYVVRTTKSGMGCAEPCWRCIDWCRWAGIKRIFHWDGKVAAFKCIKVNGVEGSIYETQGDTRVSSRTNWTL